jgi:hypothetical protein
MAIFGLRVDFGLLNLHKIGSALKLHNSHVINFKFLTKLLINRETKRKAIN